MIAGCNTVKRSGIVRHKTDKNIDPPGGAFRIRRPRPDPAAGQAVRSGQRDKRSRVRTRRHWSGLWDASTGHHRGVPRRCVVRKAKMTPGRATPGIRVSDQGLPAEPVAALSAGQGAQYRRRRVHAVPAPAGRRGATTLHLHPPYHPVAKNRQPSPDHPS